MERHNSFRTHKRHRVWLWVLSTIFLLVIAAAVSAGVIGSNLYKQAIEVKEHENKALSLVSNVSSLTDVQGLTTIVDKIPQIQHETQQAKGISHNNLWNFASGLPYVGENIKTVQGMTTVLDNLMSQSFPEFLDVMKTLQGASLSNPDGGVNLQPITDIQPKVVSANQKLQRQVQDYNNLPQPTIEQIKGPYDQGKEKLDDLAANVQSLSGAMNMLPDFLGSKEPQTYAIMALTTSEARSSGGLVGSVGEMTIQNGVIQMGDFRSNGDYLPLGAAEHSQDMARIFTDDGPLHMSFDLRDLAVMPNTKDTAEAMRSLWVRTSWGAQTPLAGVIAVDPVFVQELVKITGDVKLPSGVVLNGNNTAEYLLNTVYKDYSENETDMVFAIVVQSCIDGMFKDLNLVKLVKVSHVMDEMAKTRHFSMYAFDENVEKSIQEAGFTATTPDSEENPQVGIYLTEQNPSKMDWYVHRRTSIQLVNCARDGQKTYKVDYTIANTMKTNDVANLPAYITGVDADQRGNAIEKILFYPPAGGSISNLQMVGGDLNNIVQDTLDGSHIYRTLVTIAPESQVTFSFNVTVSPKAKQTLGIDQTPMGWTDIEVKEEPAKCR